MTTEGIDMPRQTRAAQYIAGLPPNDPLRVKVREIVTHGQRVVDPAGGDEWYVLTSGDLKALGAALNAAMTPVSGPHWMTLSRVLGVGLWPPSPSGWAAYVRRDVGDAA